jgi:hypothetical protein
MSSPGKKILCVCYGAGHVAMMIPMIRSLQSRGDWDVTVLGLTTAAAKLSAAGIPSIGFRDLVTEGDQEALRLGEELVGEAAAGPVSREESIAYMGLSYQEMIEDHGREQADRRYQESGRAAFLPVRRLGRLLDRLQPDVVLTTNSPRAERAAIVAAGQRGIPSLCMVDLMCELQLPWMRSNDFATKISFPNEQERRRVLSAGRSAEGLFVAGNPAQDALASPELPGLARDMRLKRGWTANRLTVLWASTTEPLRSPYTGEAGDPRLPQLIEQELMSIAKRRPEWTFILRPHPSENRTIAPSSPNIEISGASDPLYVLLHAVDVVIVTISTVGYEAALAGKPVVSVNRSVLTSALPYSELGVSRGVVTEGEIEAALCDVEMGRHPVRPVLPPIGQATDRICSEIMELCR